MIPLLLYTQNTKNEFKRLTYSINMLINSLPTDNLLQISDLLPDKQHSDLPLLCKSLQLPFRDLPFKRYKVDYSFTMKDLHTLINHIEGIEELEVNGLDLFFDIQLSMPRLKIINVYGCVVKAELLKMYKETNVIVNFNNCRIL